MSSIGSPNKLPFGSIVTNLLRGSFEDICGKSSSDASFETQFQETAQKFVKSDAYLNQTNGSHQAFIKFLQEGNGSNCPQGPSGGSKVIATDSTPIPVVSNTGTVVTGNHQQWDPSISFTVIFDALEIGGGAILLGGLVLLASRNAGLATAAAGVVLAGVSFVSERA